MAADKQLIETGRIVNTHGIRGELRVQPWADSPSVLLNITKLYIDGNPVSVTGIKVHKNNLIISLDGISTVEAAIPLKNKTVYALRSEIPVDDGSYYIKDLIGLKAIDNETGDTVGILEDILTLPKHNVYVLKNGEKEILIPAVDEFIKETNLNDGYVKVKVIDGM